MKLPPHRIKRIHSALKDGYDPNSLHMMVVTNLDRELWEKLNHDVPFDSVVLQLIERSEKNDSVSRLIDAAIACNTRNLLLKTLKEDSSHWDWSRYLAGMGDHDGGPRFDRLKKGLAKKYPSEDSLAKWIQDWHPNHYERILCSSGLEAKVETLVDLCWDHDDLVSNLERAIADLNEPADTRLVPSLPIGVSRWAAPESIKVVLAELIEWKEVHNDAQSLTDKIDRLVRILDRSKAKSTNSEFDVVVDTWRDDCLPQLVAVQAKWLLHNFTNSNPSVVQFRISFQDAEPMSITAVLESDAADFELLVRNLYPQLRTLRSRLWQLLSVADKMIMIKVAELKGAVANG
jgi:hypothetical protein